MKQHIVRKNIVLYSLLNNGIWPRTTDTQRELFFGKFHFLGAWAENFGGIWGIFGRTFLTHFGTVSTLSMFSIIQQIFLQKTKPLYLHPKYVFGIGILAAKELGIKPSCVRSPWIRLYKKMLTNYFFNFRNVKFGWSQNNCRSFTNVRITLAKNAWRIWGAFQTRRCLAPSAKTYGSWQPYLSQSSKYLHNPYLAWALK